ncbi:uncharacterized protein [Procambarus clarkii]
MQRRSHVVVGVAVTTVAAALLTVWSLSWCTMPATSPYYQPSALRAQYTRWPAFTSTGKHSKEWYVEHCFGGKFSEDTEDVFFQDIPRWSRATDEDCVDVYQQFDTLFEVHHRYTPKLTFPPAFAERVKVWLGGDPTLLHRVHHQHIIHVFQPLTGEHCVYNPVRSKRPGPLVRVDLHAWVDRQARETRASCDFCNLKNMTASDILGRHPTKRTMRVSNIFKVERWHSLVVTRYQHHPLNFTLDTFIAFFQDALTYINQVTEMEEQYIYPNLAWDTLYEAGASQLHPHIHMMVTPDHYYGFYEHLRTAGQRYFDATGRNYFTTLLEVHQALGLTVHYGTAVAIPTMVFSGVPSRRSVGSCESGSHPSNCQTHLPWGMHISQDRLLLLRDLPGGHHVTFLALLSGKLSNDLFRWWSGTTTHGRWQEPSGRPSRSTVKHDIESKMTTKLRANPYLKTWLFMVHVIMFQLGKIMQILYWNHF